MRFRSVGVLLLLAAPAGAAQAQGKFPPDSLVNVQVIPKSTRVIDVIGQMRNFTGWLGVRCQFCHLGEEGKPLAEFNFVSDDKRTKQVARQMMRMVLEINQRLDTLPGRTAPGLEVTCGTCHRGTSRPVPLPALLQDAVVAGGADSAIRAYRALRQRYYGRDAFDFGEASLNTAAFRVGRNANRPDDALALLKLNEEFFPASSSASVTRGNIYLMKGDTASAATSFREALKRDSTNGEARNRLRDIGQRP